MARRSTLDLVAARCLDVCVWYYIKRRLTHPTHRRLLNLEILERQVLTNDCRPPNSGRLPEKPLQSP
jgi:hypothetical protein